MIWDGSVHRREQVSVEEFPGLVDIRGSSRYGRPVLKRNDCLQSLLICLHEMPGLPALRISALYIYIYI